MAALPYIQLYVADYLADTIHLQAEEHGAYLLIIMNYWQTGKPIPESRLQSISKISNERWTDVEQTLKEFFTVTEDNLWVHARIEQDLEKVLSKSIKCSKAGKKSALAKALKVKEKSTDVQRANQQTFNHTDTNTNTNTNTDTNTKIKRERKETPKNPSLSEIQEYVILKGYKYVNAETFFNHYEGIGWMVGKNPMKKWKATIAGWESRESKKQGMNNGNNKTSSGDIFEEGTRDAYD